MDIGKDDSFTYLEHLVVPGMQYEVLALGKVAVLTVVNRRAATKDLPDYR